MPTHCLLDENRNVLEHSIIVPILAVFGYYLANFPENFNQYQELLELVANFLTFDAPEK